jgi:hypothetical protein
VPSVQMQCRTTAILRATATLAFLAPTRFINRVPHAGIVTVTGAGSPSGVGRDWWDETAAQPSLSSSLSR